MLEYEKYIVVGIMSGTSVDGLDICTCEIEKREDGWKFDILDTVVFEYSSDMKNSLINVSKLSAIEIIYLERDFSVFISNSVNSFLKGKKYKPDIIASHGHTVFHNPVIGYTYQIGNGELIAKMTGIKVVCDFRRGDVALGGQGAPLVPIADMYLFRNYSACLNLGGFSNISYDNDEGVRIAYDISPLNIILNKYSRMLGLEFDNKGEIARSGELIPDLLVELGNISFYSEPHPKSLSIEWVKLNVDPILRKFDKFKIPDLLNTLTVHMADVISSELSMHNNVLITGGGAYNQFLIDSIQKRISTTVIVPDSTLVDFKEALAFAFLGVLRIREEVNVLSSVTGAIRDSCCGIISFP